MAPTVEPPPGSTAMILGRLEGRLASLEDRLDRSEDTAAARLTVIESKIDDITKHLAQGIGGMRVVHWLGGALLAVGGFVASHFWQRN